MRDGNILKKRMGRKTRNDTGGVQNLDDTVRGGDKNRTDTVGGTKYRDDEVGGQKKS